MGDDAKVVHVTFGPSRAQSIRDALRLNGLFSRVIALSGALNYGPIDPPDTEIRREWIETFLQCSIADDLWGSEWKDATAPHVQPVYWICFSDAGEHACFLEFAYQMAERPFDIIDATGLDYVTADGIRTPWSLGLMRPKDIVASGIMARRRAFSASERNQALARWTKLRTENAPFRIVQDGKLVSAPLTHFDTPLISQAKTDWEVAAALIGRTMHHLSFDVVPQGQSPDDVVLLMRVLALGDAGKLKMRGAGPGMRDFEVRRP